MFFAIYKHMKKTEADDNLNTLKKEIDVICGYGAS